MELSLLEFIFAYIILFIFFLGLYSSIPLIIVDVMDRYKMKYDPTEHRKWIMGISILLSIITSSLILI